MKTKKNKLIKQNKIFLRIALITGLILLIPFSLMKLRIPLYDPGSGFETINWTLFDFITMGTLIFTTSSLYVLIARKTTKNRLLIAIIIATIFLWLWAELAVGIFTNWGN